MPYLFRIPENNCMEDQDVLGPSFPVHRPSFVDWRNLLFELNDWATRLQAGEDPVQTYLGSLAALLNFMKKQSPTGDASIAGPLIQLISDLNDLAQGAKPQNLFERPRKSHRPPNPSLDRTKAIIAICVGLLTEAGVSRQEAAREIAREVNKRSLGVDGSPNITTARVLKLYDEDGGPKGARKFHADLEKALGPKRPATRDAALKRAREVLDRERRSFPKTPGVFRKT